MEEKVATPENIQGAVKTEPKTVPVAEVPTQNSGQGVKIILFVVLGLILLGGVGFAAYTLGKKEVAPPVVEEEETPLTATTAPTTEKAGNLETYSDTMYGFKVQYPVGWQTKPSTEQDNYYKVTRSSVELSKNNYTVTITNMGKIAEIAKNACGALIKAESNFKQIQVPPVVLQRPKVEEGLIDGMIGVNPEGSEFVFIDLGVLEGLEKETPGYAGALNCIITVGDYRYKVSYDLPIVGEENLTKVDQVILGEMDKIVASIVWSK